MEKINKIQKLLAWPTLLDSTFVVPCLLKMKGTGTFLRKRGKYPWVFHGTRIKYCVDSLWLISGS